MIGISKDWFKDSIFGAFSSLLFIALASYGFTIGIPSFPATIANDVSRFVMVVGLASVVETVFFVGALPFLIQKATSNKLIIYLLSMVIFAGFHILAYTNGSYTLAGNASGLFMSAFLFQGFALGLAEHRDSLLTPLVLHAILNAFILTQLMSIVI